MLRKGERRRRVEMATAGGRGRSSSREGTAKAAVADQISQSIQSTSNLLHLMQQSSPYQAHLAKLPKNLLGKSDMIKNTGQVLQQLPVVISSLDAYMENGLHSIPHLKTVTQLLDNMENSQLKSAQPCLSEQSRQGPADQSSGEP